MPFHLLAALLFVVLGLGLWCVRCSRWWIATMTGVICGFLGPLMAYMSERV